MKMLETSCLFRGFQPTLLVLGCLTAAGFVGCGSTPVTLAISDAGLDGGSDAGQDAGPVSMPITLVEVFGSEGCGKCPTVELAVNPFASQSSSGIFSIEYHVTYQSPWVDIYASSAYDTVAGDDLSPNFPAGSSYTYGLPALVINAQYFSDTLYPYPKQIAGIPKAKVTPQATIALSLKSASDVNPLVLGYDVALADNGPSGGVLGFTLVERGIVSDITSGDNAGLDLQEENVARAYTSVVVGKTSGTIKITVPSGVDRSNSSVIVSLKDSTYQTLYGASELDL